MERSELVANKIFFMVICLLALVLSFVVLISGIWLGMRDKKPGGIVLFHLPLMIFGALFLVFSSTGFFGAYNRERCLQMIYNVCMLLLLIAFGGFLLFFNLVTRKGSGRLVEDRVYVGYYLGDYSSWLRNKVGQLHRWEDVVSYLNHSNVCANAEIYNSSANVLYPTDQDPIKASCCNRPSSCQQDTTWLLDCSMWSADRACYYCNMCKAGVLADMRKMWRKALVINIVAFCLMFIVYLLGCVVFIRSLRVRDQPKREATVSKLTPKPGLF